MSIGEAADRFLLCTRGAGPRFSFNFSHCIAPKIQSVNCEWDQILEGDMSSSA